MRRRQLQMAIEDLMADAPKADERRRALDRQLATLDAKIAELTDASPRVRADQNRVC